MTLTPHIILTGFLITAAGCCSVKEVRIQELPSGQMVKLGGQNLLLRQAGAGPDVVLLHGMGDSSIGWQFIEPVLIQAGYRVTIWDALGAGRSAKPAKADYSIQAHVSRLQEMTGVLGIREAVFVGHSLGGSVALRYAQQNPGKVRGLFLIDPAAYRAGAMGGRWFWETPVVAEVVLGVLPAQTITSFGLKRNFHNQAVISEQLKGMYVREAKRDGVLTALIAQERQLIPEHPEQWEAAHRTIRAPTLILWGREDQLVPFAQGQCLVHDIKGSLLVSLPNVGHSPHLESPELVLQFLLPFLAETKPR
jgi:pimeloyl-ACP methyl ester carboxylesterase